MILCFQSNKKIKIKNDKTGIQNINSKINELENKMICLFNKKNHNPEKINPEKISTKKYLIEIFCLHTEHFPFKKI